MRTPVILVAGQADTDPVVGALLSTPGTLVVEHRFDGHVVRRTTVTLTDGVLTTAEAGIEPGDDRLKAVGDALTDERIIRAYPGNGQITDTIL